MKKRWLLVVAVAVLAVSAQPVAAQNASAVASEHTTFGTGSQGEPSPTKTEGLIISGSGDAAQITLDSSDGFEDGDLNGWTQQPSGGWSATSSSPIAGSFSAAATSDGSNDLLTKSMPTENLSVSGYIRDNSGGSSGYPGLVLNAQNSSTFYVLSARFAFGEIIIQKWSGGSQTTLDTASVSLSAGTAFWLEFERSGDGLSGHIYDGKPSSGGSQLASVSATDHSLTGGGYGARAYYDGVVDDLGITAGGNSKTYIGAPHDAESVSQGWANLTLSNASATVTWQEDGDADGSWANVSSTTVSSTTNVTQDLSTTSSDRWRVRVDFEATGSAPVAEIHDEGLLFNASAPDSDMTVAAPSGKTTSSPVNISVPVSDQDFALAQGDSVSTEIQVRPSGGSFSTIATQVISSNQTVSSNYTPTEGGEHEYRVVMTDAYGSTATSSTETFSTPAQLTVYRETQNATKITGANITIRFYPVNGTGQVITKSAPNGTVNMTGLPVNQPLVAVANVSGYESRRVFIRSLYEQQRMYLLNSSADSVETIFKLRDYTGQFAPDNTVLEVRRSVDGDWQTISGDYFGASAQYPAILETGARYRLRLYNPETGATRPLGTYQPIAAQTQELTVSPTGGLSDRGALPVAVVKPQTRRIPAVNNSQISVNLTNAGNVSVESWAVAIEQNGTTLANTSYSSGTRQATLRADLDGTAGTALNVTTVATLSDGRTITVGVAQLHPYASPANQLSLLALVTDFVGLAAPGTADALTSFLATVMTIFVMAGFSTQLPVSGETTALVGVLALAAFAVIGWVGYGVVFVAGSATVAFAALRRGL